MEEEAKHGRLYIEAGDIVIVYLSKDRTPTSIAVTPGHVLTNTYGTYKHDDMVGLPFGAKVRERHGFVMDQFV
jgi:tRNA (adenine57-N1/adenine58-N1)-methyltransferase